MTNKEIHTYIFVKHEKLCQQNGDIPISHVKEFYFTFSAKGTSELKYVTRCLGIMQNELKMILQLRASCLGTAVTY